MMDNYRDHSVRLIGLAMLPVLLLAWPAAGQYFVQQGNVLDANNRVGSGGLNYGGGPDYRVNSTNRLITGNATGGASFRGYAPVRDPSQFFLGTAGNTNSNVSNLIPGSGFNSPGVLPSDRLTSFRRDSYGVNDPRMIGRQMYAPAPYYSQTSTVPNAWQIARGYNEPGSSQLRSSYTPLNTDFRVQPQNPLRNSLLSGGGQPLGVDTRLVRADAGGRVSGPVNPRLLSSTLFGNFRQVPLSDIAAQADQGEGRPSIRENEPGASDAQQRRSGRERLTTGIDGSREPGGAGQPGALPQAGNTDRFNLPLAGDPNADAAQRSGTLARPIGPPAPAAQPYRPAWRPELTPDMPLKTFTGTPDERLNEQMRLAEDNLRSQQYYDAAHRYDMAHAIDLTNPMPLFGRAMALLAAGDYLTSSNDLFMAIELAGPRATVKIDLTQFIPDLSALDRRRAFLEQRLETVDDFRLRFLLGWAEYMSGLTEDGLMNLRNAAQAAPESMDTLRRFVQSLSAQQTTRPAAATTRPG